MSFWSINEFLAEQQQIQYCFTKDAQGMNFVDPTKCLQNCIAAQQPLHSSLWVVNTMYDYLIEDGDQQIIKVAVPDYLTNQTLLNQINQLEADQRANPEQANLRSKSLYFYEIYPTIKKIAPAQQLKIKKDEIAYFLEKRGNCILARASAHPGGYKVQPILNKYTQSQMELYSSTKQKIFEYNNWRYHKNRQ